jgi:uncharacterized protein (TIGR02145 family)
MKKNVIKKQLKRVLFLGIKGFLTVALCGLIVPAMAQTGAETCVGTAYTIGSVEPASGAPTYRWLEDGVPISNTDAATYTVPADKEAGSYVYTRQAMTADCHLWQSSNEFVVTVSACSVSPSPGSCTAASATVDFSEFNPCPDAEVGTVWYLTDTREADNQQTYKVKKLADGHIWMVQDMKFGNQCGTTFAGATTTASTGNVSDIGTYYGDCTTAASTATPAERGYLYDWAAAINAADAYYGSSSNVGCSGTSSACQGICPDGWHIPTGASAGEFLALSTALGGCADLTDQCWNADSAWEGVLGGGCSSSGSLNYQGSRAYYWSSTYYSSSNAYTLYFYSSSVNPGTNNGGKNSGRAVRCLRNY